MRHAVLKCKGPGETATHMAAAGNTQAAFASMATSTSAGFPDLSLSRSLSLPPLNLQQLPGAALKCCNLSLSHSRLSLSLSCRHTFSPIPTLPPSIISPALQLQLLQNVTRQIFIAESAERCRKNEGYDVKRVSVNGHEAGSEGVNCVGCFSVSFFFSCCL